MTSKIIEYRVLFPLVGQSPRLAEISISNAGIYNQNHKIVSGGPRIYYLKKEHEIDEILRSARFKEFDEKRDLYVMAEFYNTDNCKINGQSYGLSLILADKLARIYQPKFNFKVIATGKIDQDQQIKAIGFFEEKLHYILKQNMDGALNKGDCLFLSIENIQQANKAEKELLIILKKRGIKIFPVGDIEGLDNQLIKLFRVVSVPLLSSFKEYSWDDNIFSNAQFKNHNQTHQLYIVHILRKTKLINFKIIAMGEINKNHEIKIVDSFEQKLHFILQQKKKNAVCKDDYLFIPEENNSQLNLTGKELLLKLMKKGVKIYPVNHVNAVNKILGKLSPPKTPHYFKFFAFIFNIIILTIFNLSNFYLVTALSTESLYESIRQHFLFIAILGIMLVGFTMLFSLFGGDSSEGHGKKNTPSLLPFLFKIFSPRIVSFFFALYGFTGFTAFNILTQNHNISFLQQDFMIALVIATLISTPIAKLFSTLITWVIKILSATTIYSESKESIIYTNPTEPIFKDEKGVVIKAITPSIQGKIKLNNFQSIYTANTMGKEQINKGEQVIVIKQKKQKKQGIEYILTVKKINPRSISV